MLAIRQTKIDATKVICSVKECEIRIDLEFDTHTEENAGDMAIVINFSHDTGNEVKTMNSIKIGETTDLIYDTDDDNYDFRLAVSDAIYAELKYLFPYVLAEERNTITAGIDKKVEDAIDNEGINIL